MKPEYVGKYWSSISESAIQCHVCPRQCLIKEGSHGFCYVRQNHNNQLILTTYGRSSGFCVDPIEKKPLNHFLPGSPVLSFGTAGCNLGCQFCQNWDISKAKKLDVLQSQAMPEAIVQAAIDHGCQSIAFTYNDPVIFLEYALDVAKLARESGIKTVAVSAGYIEPEPRRDFFEYMDAVNVDLKAFTQLFYKRVCRSELQPVLDTLEYVKYHTSTWLEITNLVIPTYNDSKEEIKQMMHWVLTHLGPDVPIHFSAFHPDFNMKDVPPTSKSTLVEARELALSMGLHYVYTGNVIHAEGDTTFCPSCQAVLVERNWYDITSYSLTETGKCYQCDTVIPGVWSHAAGTWGRKRQPIRIP